MKKLLFVLCMFMVIGVQGFATTAIVKIDVRTVENVDMYTVLDVDLEAISTGEMKSTGENDKNKDCETCCTNCSIIPVTCHCGVGFLVQYCKGGCCPHPPLETWVMDLCEQACPPQV